MDACYTLALHPVRPSSFIGRTDLPDSNDPDMPPDPLHRSPRSSLGLALALQKKGWVLLQTSEILFSIIVSKLRRRSSAFWFDGAVHSLPPIGADETAAAIGFVTFIFGLGQISGPTVAGMLAERTGAFSRSFYMAAAFAAAAIALSGFLQKPRTA